ncbi:MAG: helix-turn-helix transcriptional regulator [Alphaproteobacteria bacterium]
MTPALIRAARGLLNWQQQDLATASGLSLSAVNNYERNLGKTRPVTLKAMTSTLEEAGIEFLASGGVRHSDDIMNIQRFSGADYIQKMNEDIYASVRKTGQDIFTCSTDESRWYSPDVKKSAEQYYAWRKKMNVKEYYLVADGNTVFESPKQHYRFLPEAMIGKITYAIYADRIALINWRKKQVIILRGNHLVEPFREQFKYLWRLAKKT